MSGTDLPMYMGTDIIGAKRSTLSTQNEPNKNENSAGESHRFIISFTKCPFLGKPNTYLKSGSVFKAYLNSLQSS